jgi:hypothetical protein
VTPETAFLKALIAVLKADAGVEAVVADRIFDEVPEDERGLSLAQPPYLYVGPVNTTRVELGAWPASAWRVRARLYAVSTAFGRLEAWSAAHAARKALEGVELTLDDPFAAQEPVTATQAGDVTEPLNPKAVFVDLSTTIME